MRNRIFHIEKTQYNTKYFLFGKCIHHNVRFLTRTSLWITSGGIVILCFLAMQRISLTPNALSVEMDAPNPGGTYQLLYDIGRGFNDTDSLKMSVLSGKPTRSVHFFPLPLTSLSAIRLDLRPTGTIRIKAIRMEHEFRRLHWSIPVYQWTGETLVKHVQTVHGKGVNAQDNPLLLNLSSRMTPYFQSGDLDQVYAAIAKKTSLFKALCFSASLLVAFSGIGLDMLRQRQWLWSSETAFFLLIGCLITGNVLIFEEFLFGNACLLFKDLGLDSITQILPFTHFFTNVYRFGDFWMHGSVLGNNIFMSPMEYNIFAPLLHLVCFNATVPQTAQRIVYYVILNSMLAGVFFYKFLVRSRLTSSLAVIGAICYSLSGGFIANSTWVATWIPPLTASLAMVLWALKVWQQDRRWYLFPLAISYFILTTSVIITLYQLTIFLGLYLLFDFVSTGEKLTRHHVGIFLLELGKIALIGAVGVFLTAIVLFPHIYYMWFENYRAPTAGISLWALPHIKEVLVVFLRLFSNDLAGTANMWTQYYQFSNYFELPFLYNGLLFVMMIPACSLIAWFHPRQRTIWSSMAILFVLFLLTNIFPGLRAYIFYTGKFRYYYRWMAVFTSAVMALSGCYALEGVLAAGDRVRKGAVASVTLGLLSMLGVCAVSLAAANWPILDLPWLGFIGICLIGYAGIFQVSHRLVRQGLLVALVMIELTLQGHHTVSDQRHPLRSFPMDFEVFAHPDMLDALVYVSQQEPQRFFRLSQTEWSRNENSALAQAYYGTKGYTSFNNSATIEFFRHRKIRPSTHDSSFMFAFTGFQERYVLDNLVGVKYYLKRGDLLIPPWARKLTTIGDTKVYVNPQAFPLGIVYQEYLFQRELDALPLSEPEKDNLFMLAAVLPDGNDLSRFPEANLLQHLDAPILKVTNATEVMNAIQQKQHHAMELTAFQNDVITGTLQTDRGGLLFLSIPFDPGWQIFLDGKVVQKLKVNIGFLGTVVPPGHHTVRLEYVPPYYRLGHVVSVGALGFIIVVVSLLRTSARQWFCICDR